MAMSKQTYYDKLAWMVVFPDDRDLERMTVQRTKAKAQWAEERNRTGVKGWIVRVRMRVTAP